MILALKKIREVENLLNDKIAESVIVDYRIALKLNMEINVFVLVEDDKIELPELKNDPKINFEIITKVDCESDGFYEYLFDKEKNPKKIDLTLRRRYTNWLEKISEKKQDFPFPVVTFYSYKGGLGRSTTLAAFAAHYAMHERKRVVILDCDFEAPGFTNFFDLTDELLAQKNGVVEYLLDKQFAREELDLGSYTIEVSKAYSGDGEIHIIPAGNLKHKFVIPDDSDSGTHQKHYLEALSRLNLSSPDQLVNQFIELLNHVQGEIKPDIILIDSRTGFNDIFANIGFSVSSLVIGFYSSSTQTMPGLYFFLDKVIQEDIPTILVNSINPYPQEIFFKEFEELVNSYLQENFDISDEVPYIDKYSITREPRLEVLGTGMENKTSFINMIKDRSFHSYNILFEAIVKRLKDRQEIENQKTKEGEVITEKLKEVSEAAPTQQDAQQLSKKEGIASNQILSLKRRILQNLRDNPPKPYGENVVMDEDFLNKSFYFRKCMEDIFNRDKFLILGSKGTGKTFFYQAFEQEAFIRKLAEKAGKRENEYEFINIISLKREENPTKLLEVATNFPISEIRDPTYFFTRFWRTYSWNAILIDVGHQHFGFESALPVEPMTNDTHTKERFLAYITSDEKQKVIETELRKIDTYLKNNKSNLIIAFDQLDFIVKPNLWSKGTAIAPLIEFWRSNPYSRILPKLFVRTDLFEKLGGVTNKQELKRQAISIEWSQEELFAFFFKIVFAHSKAEFYNIMCAYGDFPDELIDEIKEAAGKDNQIPLIPKYLKPLAETFFGKWADWRGTARFGETYDWLYRNLQNADGTISLRPFLDLIWAAIKNYFQTEDNYPKPILYPRYFATPPVREAAVERHFKDLADEEGNRDLEKIFDYIKSKAPLPLKKSFLSKREFETLLQSVIEAYKNELEYKTIDELKELLVVNGIISVKYKPGGYTAYAFAYLYKYYLGLSNKRT